MDESSLGLVWLAKWPYGLTHMCWIINQILSYIKLACIDCSSLDSQISTGSSKINRAKLSDACSVRANWLSMGCAILLGRNKAGISNRGKIFLHHAVAVHHKSFFLHESMSFV